MAKLGDGLDAYVDESMPFLFDKFGDARALKEHGCLTVAQCALLVPAMLTADKPGDASEMAAHWLQLALLDIGHGELNPKHPETHLPYSQYQRMTEAGMYGIDGEGMPMPTADWLVSLDEAEAWFTSKNIKVNFDGVRADLERMRTEGLGDWPSHDHEKTSAAPLVQRSDMKASPAKPITTQHKLRTNSLDAPIKKAIGLAGSLETGAVYLKLRELALGGEAPFSGAFDADALCYTNDRNEPDKLTKNALGKRLKKHSL
jgi:hypothetical protein